MTSTLDAIHSDGITNWHIEQTAAFAVTHIDDLLNRTEEQGMRYLQYFSRRMTSAKMDQVTVYDYSMGVLDDLSETGTFMHTYMEAHRNGWFEPEPHPSREDLWQMIEAYLVWDSDNDLQVVTTEATLFGHTPDGRGYAGTADWFGNLNGVATLGDDKTSRKVHDSHEAQLAALGACHTWAREVSEGTPGAVHYEILPSVAKHHGGQVDSWWVEESVPDFVQYGVLQVRPDDGPERSFAKFHEISYDYIEAGYDLFQSALSARHAQAKRRKLENARKKGEK